MDEQVLKSYKQALLEVARSRTAIMFCVTNLNIPASPTEKGVYDEVMRLSQLSGDSMNEVMTKIILALLHRAEAAEEKLVLGDTSPKVATDADRALISQEELGTLKQATKIMSEVVNFLSK